MKVNNLYIAISLVWAGMTACTNDAPGMELSDKASRIYLSAAIGQPVSSRAPYCPTDEAGETLDAPTSEHPLNVSVWASTTDGEYPDQDLDGSNGTVAIHTEAHFQSNVPQLLGDAIYPNVQGEEAKTVYFVGFHPQSNDEQSWTASNDNKSATFTFTGKEDVMFAPQISGTYGTDIADSPQFHFHHLLTWLRIEMVADKDETDIQKKEAIAEAWGKIKSLTINSRNQVTVNALGKADVTKDNIGDNLTFGDNEIPLSFYQTGTDDVFPQPDESYSIPTALKEVAYVLCAPVQGVYQHTVAGEDVLKPEYTLHIETEKRTLDIPVDLKTKADDDESAYFTQNTRGHQFVILLNFKMGNVISVSAEISLGANADWYTHGTGTGDIKEEVIINTGTE